MAKLISILLLPFTIRKTHHYNSNKYFIVILVWSMHMNHFTQFKITTEIGINF